MTALLQHSEHYMLELQLQHDKKKWYVFAQGISPLFYRLENLQHFRITKQWIDSHTVQLKSITWTFLRFQQFVRRRYRLKKFVVKHLRQLETGTLPFHQGMSNLG